MSETIFLFKFTIFIFDLGENNYTAKKKLQ